MSYDGMLCPYCNGETWCEMVDVGPGSIQGGPHICNDCDSSEMHHNDVDFRREDGSYWFSDLERREGWMRSEWVDEVLVSKAKKAEEERLRILELNRSRLEKVESW